MSAAEKGSETGYLSKYIPVTNNSQETAAPPVTLPLPVQWQGVTEGLLSHSTTIFFLLLEILTKLCVDYLFNSIDQEVKLSFFLLHRGDITPRKREKESRRAVFSRSIDIC